MLEYIKQSNVSLVKYPRKLNILNIMLQGILKKWNLHAKVSTEFKHWNGTIRMSPNIGRTVKRILRIGEAGKRIPNRCMTGKRIPSIYGTSKSPWSLAQGMPLRLIIKWNTAWKSYTCHCSNALPRHKFNINLRCTDCMLHIKELPGHPPRTRQWSGKLYAGNRAIFRNQGFHKSYPEH